MIEGKVKGMDRLLGINSEGFLNISHGHGDGLGMISSTETIIDGWTDR